MSDAALKLQRPLRDYITFFEKLNPRSLKLIGDIMDKNVYFKDPFNAVTGVDQVEKIFAHMFQTMENPKFKVMDYGFGKQGEVAYIRWRFTFMSNGSAQGFDGMSEVEFNADGKVISHVDYWDAGEVVYEKIPLLGAAIRFVKSKLAAG